MYKRLLIRVLISSMLFLPFLLHNRGDIHMGWLERLEQLTYDVRLVFTMPNTIDDRIVIVDLDEKSLLEEGQWPWPRNRVARLVDRLFDDYQIKVLGFDIVFAEPDNRSGLPVLERLAQDELRNVPQFRQALESLRPALDTDGLFAKALAGRPAVLGYVFRHAGDAGEDVSSGMLPQPLIPSDQDDTNIPFAEAIAYTGNIALLQNNTAGGFFENALVDGDGKYRRVPLLQKYHGNLYPSLAFAVAHQVLGRPKLSFVFQHGADGPRDGLDLDWLTLGDKKIPVGEDASVLVPYRGQLGSFPYVSATDVLHGRAAKYPLKGAIVLMGTSAAGLHDLRNTPIGNRFTGVEIHANIVSGILDETIMHHPRYVQGIEITILVLLAILMTAVLPRVPVMTATLVTVLILLLITVLNLVIWGRGNFVLPLASLLSFTFLLYFLHMIYGYFVEARGKRELSGLFGQYVPPELVAEMGNNPGDFSMRSESREMTVMFADIRNFTGIAEQLSPPEVSELLNAFLTPMTRVIQRHRGTIDKYIGDAIMAFWGAPVRDQQHARNALLSAIEMQGALSQLQKGFDRRGWPEIKVGIGLNTGEMRVGNMGSSFRMAYTVMGDSVNLGARLENLTKTYGVTIAVGDATRKAVPDFAFLELDRVRVKGKDNSVAIFSPVGPLNEMGLDIRQMLKKHAVALQFYRERDWDSAEKEFFGLAQSFPERRLFSLYLDRVTHFRSNPPADDWDGISIILHK